MNKLLFTIGMLFISSVSLVMRNMSKIDFRTVI